MIEHNLEVIKTADWVIDLGPEGGARGGRIVGAGTPEAIANLPGSYTGKYLVRLLNGMAVATERRLLMAASKSLASALLALACVCAAAQDASPPPVQSSSSPSSPTQSSPAQPSGAHRSVHHIQVLDDDSPAQPPELTQAEAAIEKQNYAAAEPLLRKLVERDATSYEGWFDLGFVENALGNVDASIAAYRKSVAAKPDVFESNLNLGLQLAKTGQPGAEEFLRAATHLKPTSHVVEGQYRAWLALGHTLEKSKPEEALDAYQRAASLQPKETEPHFAAGMLLERENKFADAEQEYKQALALDPGSSDAAIALANLSMRGRRFPEAEDYLRRLLAEHPYSAPESAAVEIQLGRVLAAEGKTDEAIAMMQAGIKLAPGDEAAQRDLAELYASCREERSGGVQLPCTGCGSSERCGAASIAWARRCCGRRNSQKLSGNF